MKKSNKYILGVSAFFHDSAACLLDDGEILAAAEEERFSRIKGDAAFPRQAIKFCLDFAGINQKDLLSIVYYDKPLLLFSRLLQSYIEHPLKSFQSFSQSVPLWASEKLKISSIFQKELPGFSNTIFYAKHHDSHAASAFFCSPFEEAAIIVADGVGEWACTSIGRGYGNKIEMLKECHFPHSIGLFYSAITQYLGFKVNEDEYKVMGLAPYGRPIYKRKIQENLIDVKPDGSIALNLDYFPFCYGLKMIHPKLEELFGMPERDKKNPLNNFHMDVAASLQAVTNDVMIKLARHAKDLTGAKTLCLAGGVALNGVANGKIFKEKIFEKIYIQPASGDAGGAIGAAMQCWHQLLKNKRISGRDRMKGALLGPEINENAASWYFSQQGENVEKLSTNKLVKKVVKWISQGKVVGWCQGRMEFGPRALGARSILGDPRKRETQAKMNLKIKFRESFRPFAPAILAEHAAKIFEIDESPYMLKIVPLKKKFRRNKNQNKKTKGIKKIQVVRSFVPAVTHVDYSARLQTVDTDAQPLFRKLVLEFFKKTSCPMLVNTSFNVAGEPIVCNHKDAYYCYRMSKIDILVYGNLVIKKGIE